MNFLRLVWEKSITLFIFKIILESFQKSYKKSHTYDFLYGPEKKLDYFSSSKIFQASIEKKAIFIRILYPIKKYLDKFIKFCSENTLKIYFINAMLIITISHFVRNNIFTEIIMIPLLSLIFITFCINLIKKYVHEDHKSIIVHSLIIFFLIKLIFMILLNQTYTFPDERAAYLEFSWSFTKKWLGDLLTAEDNYKITTTTHAKVYFYLNAMIFYLFGKHILLGKLLNLFIHIITGILIYLIAFKIFDTTKDADKKTSIISMNLFYILPSINLWSLVLMKEALNIFFTALLFLIILTFQGKKIKLSNLIITGLLSFIIMQILTDIRPQLTQIAYYSLIIGLSLFVLKEFFTQYKNFKWILTIIPVIIIFTSILSLGNTQLNEKIHDSLNQSSIMMTHYLKTINHARKTLANDPNGRYVYYKEVDILTIKKLIKFMPTAIFHGLFSPFPTHAKNLRLLIYFLGNIIWYSLITFFITGLFFSIKNKFVESSMIIIYSLSLLTLISLSEGNLGNLIRHSVQYISFMLIFCAHGIAKTFPEHVKFPVKPNQQSYTLKDTTQL